MVIHYKITTVHDLDDEIAILFLYTVHVKKINILNKGEHNETV